MKIEISFFFFLIIIIIIITKSRIDGVEPWFCYIQSEGLDYWLLLFINSIVLYLTITIISIIVNTSVFYIHY